MSAAVSPVTTDETNYFRFEFVAPQVALFTFQKVKTSPTNLDTYFQHFKALLLASKQTNTPISIIVNLKDANWINIPFVKSKIDFIKELQAENLVKNNLRSSAVIFESVFTSWVLDMILKFVKTQSPVSSFLNVPDAIDWSLKQ